MTIGDMLNPNKEIPESSRIWYVLALVSLVIALYIAFSAEWQHGAVFVAENGVLKKTGDAVDISLAPKMSTMLIAVLFYASLLVRRCIRGVSNMLTLALVIGNVLLVSTLIESIIPAQEVPLLSFFGLDILKVTPQEILCFVILFSWIGMRAIAGFGVVFLIWAFVARASSVNVALGLYGALYVLFSFVTLMLQMKLPYMMPEGGILAVLKQDFGLISSEAKKDMCATTDAVKKTVAVGVSAVGAAVSAVVPGAALVSGAVTGEITKGLSDKSQSEKVK